MVFRPVHGESHLEIDNDQLLGQGGFGVVIKGRYHGKDVAVKMVRSNVINEREEDALRSLAHHENVVHLIHVVRQYQSHRLYVLELCQATLEEAYYEEDNAKKYRGPIPSEHDILLQFSKGLAHVHTSFVHRDVKPENVLISTENPVRIKVGDFGLSKPVSTNGSFQISGLKGTENWMAPELLIMIDEHLEECQSATPEKVRQWEVFIKEQRTTKMSDVFSAGCVMFYIVTKGIHPFGWFTNAVEKIKKNNPIYWRSLPRDHYAGEIIRKMIDPKPEQRMSMEEVAKELEKLKDKTK